MTYLERIKTLIANIPIELVDFSQERTPANKPTQASSNFITNKEQGDWAEKLVMEAINSTFHEFMAVHYGKNDDLVAWDDGFDDFYQEFQNELDTIGKRPDLLIFKKKDYRADLGTDISKSFEQILGIIANSDNEGSIFSVEQDTKNQNKTTIKIRSNAGLEIAYKVDEPEHHSIRREMGRGRLLYYVSFQGGTAYLNVENLNTILQLDNAGRWWTPRTT